MVDVVSRSEDAPAEVDAAAPLLHGVEDAAAAAVGSRRLRQEGRAPAAPDVRGLDVQQAFWGILR